MRRAMLLATTLLITKWKSVRSADDKISGGSEVGDIREMPYIIAISQVERNCTVGKNGTRECHGIERWYYTCGGSLLSPHYVITACHCVADFQNSTEKRQPAVQLKGRVEDWRYVAGSRSLNPLDGSAQIRIPLELHHHPNCAKEEALAISDIGIAKFVEPFIINEYVMPVKLLSTERQKFQAALNEVLQHKPKCLVSGWGSTWHETINKSTNEPVTSGHGTEVSYILKTATMEVLTEGVCVKKFKVWADHDLDDVPMEFDKLGQICITSRKGNEGFCSGDSGSPFVCNGYFVALVSNSIECGTPLPQICQTVLVLFDWIRNDFCKRSDCSDVYYQQSGAREKPKPSKKDMGGSRAERSFVVRVNPKIATAILIHLINSM